MFQTKRMGSRTNHSDESGFIDCSISSLSSNSDGDKELEEQIGNKTKRK